MQAASHIGFIFVTLFFIAIVVLLMYNDDYWSKKLLKRLGATPPRDRDYHPGYKRYWNHRDQRYYWYPHPIKKTSPTTLPPTTTFSPTTFPPTSTPTPTTFPPTTTFSPTTFPPTSTPTPPVATTLAPPPTTGITAATQSTLS
jgi:hypothetical protein